MGRALAVMFVVLLCDLISFSIILPYARRLSPLVVSSLSDTWHAV